MQSQTQKRYLVYLLLVATFALSGASASSQERKAVSANDELQVGPALSCPTPRHVQLTHQAPAAATPYLPDFQAANCSAIEPNYGGTKSDKCFIDTFSVPIPSELCCQCVESKKNVLTIRYQALVGGPVGSSSSYNDTVGIYPGALSAKRLYQQGVPTTTGQLGTTTIPLTCAMLKSNPLRLSYLVQDDTKVISATLDVDLCCVRK